MAGLVGLLAPTLLTACGEADKPAPGDDLSGLNGQVIEAQAKADLPSTIKLVGSLDGTTATTTYTRNPRYRAYKFGGNAGEQVDITVHASGGKDAVAWLLDDSGNVVASNDDADDTTLDSRISATLPGNTNPDIITYYIVFREYSLRRATFTVTLTRQACVERVFCRQGSHFDTTTCQCVNDNQFCGGIAGIQCPAGLKCVDNPADSCDPASGGADCGGICVPSTGCDYNGQHYDSGQGFPSSDGCNSCSCTDSGVRCTLRACPAPDCTVSGCAAGQTCSPCRTTGGVRNVCIADGIAC
jgi:hypothetical protein